MWAHMAKMIDISALQQTTDKAATTQCIYNEFTIISTCALFGVPEIVSNK